MLDQLGDLKRKRGRNPERPRLPVFEEEDEVLPEILPLHERGIPIVPAAAETTSYSESGVQLEYQKQVNPILNPRENLAVLAEDLRVYDQMLENLKTLKDQMPSDVFELGEKHLRVARSVRENRSKLFQIVNEMIQYDHFRSVNFDKSTVIHFENGYLTSKGYFHGLVDEDTQRPDFDGVKGDQRLASYHLTLKDSYLMAKEIGDKEVIRFFSSFRDFPCMDGRTTMVSLYQQELRIRYDLYKNSSHGDKIHQKKKDILESLFMDCFGEGMLSVDQIKEAIGKNWLGKIAEDGVITQADIDIVVDEKWALVFG